MRIIVVIQNNQVAAQLPGAAGKTAFPIPVNGYLLVYEPIALPLRTVRGLCCAAPATSTSHLTPNPRAGPILVKIVRLFSMPKRKASAMLSFEKQLLAVQSVQL